MTDRDLRQLERAAAQGDPAASAGWLRAVIRSGGCACEGGKLEWLERGGQVFDVEACPACGGSGNRQRHLAELLAYCGDEAAREAIGADLPWKTSDEILELEHWLQGLNRWDTACEIAHSAADKAVGSLRLGPYDVMPLGLWDTRREAARHAACTALCAWAWGELEL